MCASVAEAAGLKRADLEAQALEHLPAIAEDGLAEWIQKDKAHWRPQVINFARNFVERGLIGRGPGF